MVKVCDIGSFKCYYKNKGGILVLGNVSEKRRLFIIKNII